MHHTGWKGALWVCFPEGQTRLTDMEK